GDVEVAGKAGGQRHRGDRRLHPVGARFGAVGRIDLDGKHRAVEHRIGAGGNHPHQREVAGAEVAELETADGGRGTRTLPAEIGGEVGERGVDGDVLGGDGAIVLAGAIELAVHVAFGADPGYQRVAGVEGGDGRQSADGAAGPVLITDPDAVVVGSAVL